MKLSRNTNMSIDLLIDWLLKLKQDHNLTGKESAGWNEFDFDYETFYFHEFNEVKYNEKENRIEIT